MRWHTILVHCCTQKSEDYFKVQNWIIKLQLVFSGIEVDGAVGGSEAVDAIAEALRTYQNQVWKAFILFSFENYFILLGNSFIWLRNSFILEYSENYFISDRRRHRIRPGQDGFSDLGDLLRLRGIRWGFATRGQGGNLAPEDKSGKFATTSWYQRPTAVYRLWRYWW